MLFRAALDGALDFVEHAAGLDRCAPAHRSTLTGTLTSSQRLSSHGMVGEHADPNLTAAADVAHHGDTGGFDLLAGKLAMFNSLQANFTESDGSTAVGRATQAAFLPLAEFDSLRSKHY